MLLFFGLLGATYGRRSGLVFTKVSRLFWAAAPKGMMTYSTPPLKALLAASEALPAAPEILPAVPCADALLAFSRLSQLFLRRSQLFLDPDSLERCPKPTE